MVFGTRIEWTAEYLYRSVLFTQGYSKTDPYIQDFVSVLMSFSQELKEKFMMFVTGERRISVCTDTWNQIQIQEQLHEDHIFTVVEKVTGLEGSLPSAATCIRSLNLPRYVKMGGCIEYQKSKEEMKNKLILAITMGNDGQFLV